MVHGDLKPAHLVVGDHGALLVDWEMFGRGDPAWDLASVFAAPLAAWALGECADPTTRPRTGAALDGLAPYAQDFWRAYRSQRPEGTVPQLAHVGRLVGARLLQSAYEAAADAPRPSAAALRLQQLGLNVVASPGALTALLRLTA